MQSPCPVRPLQQQLLQQLLLVCWDQLPVHLAVYPWPDPTEAEDDGVVPLLGPHLQQAEDRCA